jgi:hypothetical protein
MASVTVRIADDGVQGDAIYGDGEPWDDVQYKAIKGSVDLLFKAALILRGARHG